MSGFGTDDNEEVYEVENILDHRKQRGKNALEYLIKWKDYDDSENTWERESNINAPELLESYWKRNGGKHGRDEAKKNKKRKRAKAHTSSSKPYASATEQLAPSLHRPITTIIDTTSSNNVTPEIPFSKRSLSPPVTKDERQKRIRNGNNDDQVPSLSSPSKVATQRQPIVEAAEDQLPLSINSAEDEESPQSIVETTPEEPELSTVEAIPEEEPQQSTVEAIPEEEPQQSTAEAIPEEESQQPTVEATPDECDQDKMMHDQDENVEKDKLMEELPIQDTEMTKEQSLSRSPTPEQHLPTTDTEMVDASLTSDNEIDKPTTTSFATGSQQQQSSKLSQSDIRTFIKGSPSTSSRTMYDFELATDKLSSNKENIAHTSDTIQDNEDHPMPGTPKDKQFKEIDVNDVIWDPEYPPAPCNWSQEAECVETVVADPNDKKTFHAIVRWKNGKLSMHQSSVLREKCPHLLIDFYETRLKFTKQSQVGIPSSVHVSSKRA